jgi:hypothetical protein
LCPSVDTETTSLGAKESLLLLLDVKLRHPGCPDAGDPEDQKRNHYELKIAQCKIDEFVKSRKRLKARHSGEITHAPLGAGHPRIDEMAYTPHPPTNLPLEGGGKLYPPLQREGKGGGWGGRLISNEAGIQ